ncbi:MAG: acetyl-CoA carboxylase, carboxyltransferase subunit beta [Psittacicella sp.]
MSNWIEKISTSLKFSLKPKTIPDGLWSTCENCQQIIYKDSLIQKLYICPNCGHHKRLKPNERASIFLNKDSYKEIFQEIESKDILKFKDSKSYKIRLSDAKKTSGSNEALSVYKGSLKEHEVILCVFNFFFMGGSMNAAVGSKFVAAANLAMEENKALICFSASGGARMQEGLTSLMQMAKTSAIIEKMSETKTLFISILTDPTMGGVSASLAMLGDIIIAEPKATIGFSGARVIKQTVGQDLPEGFQKSEFLLKHGAIDMIVSREDLRNTVSTIISNLI